LTREEDLEVFRANAEKQREMGAPVEVITPLDAREIVPGLVTDDLVGATFCPEDGLVNPHAIVQGYAKKAREMGVVFQMSAEVTKMEVGSGRIRSLTAAGERWEVGWVVNGAGPWAARLGEMCNAPVPVEPYRRMGFTSQPMAWIPDTFPMLIDWGSGVYMHKESGGMLMGESDRDEPASFNQQVDLDYLAVVGDHALHRMPSLEHVEVRSSFAGLYEVSPDHNAILGRVPEVDNFVCANGFSGHGMMHAPAVGIGLAELITEGSARTVDLSSYTIERFNREERVPEHNVI
jgi:sarcosine oxidase subunit beta